MSEWWTYSLSDFLLFAPRAYYRLFELYNAAIWPAQLVAMLVGVAIAIAPRRSRPWHGRAALLALAAAWLWIALAYHLTRYATINWAAEYYAIGFAAEALLLALSALAGSRLAPERIDRPGIEIGAGLFVFAVAIQPLIGFSLGRPWSQIELFAIAPDPTAVATIGLALSAAGGARWLILPLPLAWCAISGATLWAMGSPDFMVMPAVIGAAALALWLTRRRAAAL